MAAIKLYLPDDMPLADIYEWARSKGLQMSAKCAEDDTLLVYALRRSQTPHNHDNQENKNND